ncbi:MAG: condensation domain-containing protein [Polyangiaceae bacterium]|jgi:hypothetical protein
MYSLSSGQEAMWLRHVNDPADASYHTAFAARIASRLDVVRLREALSRVVERHASLHEHVSVR